jgi:type IV pilus assembly protein PilE
LPADSQSDPGLAYALKRTSENIDIKLIFHRTYKYLGAVVPEGDNKDVFAHRYKSPSSAKLNRLELAKGGVMNALRRNTGFTLIELMITIAVIAILAGLAYPSYTEYVMRARRADAKAALLKVQLAQEKYRANNTSYGTLAQIGVLSTSPDQYYTIAVTSNTATDYTATATPTGVQAGDSCGTFAVNKNGKTTSTSVQTETAKVQECWGK